MIVFLLVSTVYLVSGTTIMADSLSVTEKEEMILLAQISPNRQYSVYLKGDEFNCFSFTPTYKKPQQQVVKPIEVLYEEV